MLTFWNLSVKYCCVSCFCWKFTYKSNHLFLKPVLFFIQGLGKKKPTTPSQHHKQTKDILSWNSSTKTATTTNERLHQTSYNSSFRPTKRPMTAATNILFNEPVHCRGNPTIHRRRLLSARSFTENTFHSPPLLAWGASDNTTSSHNFKPCVGDSYHRTIQRAPPEVTIETRTMLTKRNLRAKSAFWVLSCVRNWYHRKIQRFHGEVIFSFWTRLIPFHSIF